MPKGSHTKQVLAALEGKAVEASDNSMEDVAEQIGRLVRVAQAQVRATGKNKPLKKEAFNLKGLAEELAKLVPTTDMAPLMAVIQKIPHTPPVAYEFTFIRTEQGLTSKVIATPISSGAEFA